MTAEEAIECLNKAKGNAEALEMAKIALTKEMSKKPYKKRLEYYCPNDHEEPVCVGKNHTDGHKTRKEYCPACGKRIDWSEEK